MSLRTSSTLCIATLTCAVVSANFAHEATAGERDAATSRPHANAPADSTCDESLKLSTQAYPVADLVQTFPGIGVLSLDGDGKPADDPQAPPRLDLSKPDFEPLIDGITAKIEPNSWKAAGGEGVIAGEPKTLSLVVRQTQKVHDQIAELVHRMRRELDVQVCLEVRRVKIPGELLEAMPQDVQAKDRATLDERSLALLIQAVQEDDHADVLSAPKVTLFNEQALWVRETTDGEESSIVLHPSISTDRRSVKLSLAASGRHDDQHAILSETVRLRSGETILLDRGGPTQDAQRELLLITPRVIVAEEEEELVSLSAKPIGK